MSDMDYGDTKSNDEFDMGNEDDVPKREPRKRRLSIMPLNKSIHESRKRIAVGMMIALFIVVVGSAVGVVFGTAGLSGSKGPKDDDTSAQSGGNKNNTVASAIFVQRLETTEQERLTEDEQKAFCGVIENNAAMALKSSENEGDYEAFCEVTDQKVVSGTRHHRGLRDSNQRRELEGALIDVTYSLEYRMDPTANGENGVDMDENNVPLLLTMFKDYMNDHLSKVTDNLNSAGVSVENIGEVQIIEVISTGIPEINPTDSSIENSTSLPTDSPTTSPIEDSADEEENDNAGTDFELSDTPAFYRSARNAPFPVQMAKFSSKIVDGYSSCIDLQDDVLTAARIQANAVIMQQAKNGDSMFPVMYEIAEVTNVADESVTESKEGNEGFETNNQVQGVNEADVIKSNGREIYAAYGDKIIALEANGGRILSETVMPKLESIGEGCNYVKPPIIIYEEPEEEAINVIAADPQEPDTTPEEETEKTVVPEPKIAAMPIYGDSKPIVRSLMLDGDRLTVAVESQRNWCSSENQPILSDYGRTHIRLYDVSDPTQLVLIGTRDLQGTYREARRIDSNAHFVSVTNVNTFSLLEPLYRWRQEYSGLNDTEYILMATEIATKQTDIFARKLLKEMAMNDLDCSNMARISMMETGSHTGDADELDSSYSDGILNGYAQVTTLDMQHEVSVTSDINGTENNLSVHASGIFLRTYSVEVYASQSTLVLFGTGYRWDFTSSSQTTYLCTFRLQDGTATPTAVGAVPGDLLDQFSIDHKGDYLRVASTESSTWGYFNHTDGDGNIFQRWRQETNNRITVLRFPDQSAESGEKNNTVLEEVGYIDGLGEPGERIFAVRYVGNLAYVVTFLQTDPFYTIDMSDAQNPKMVGELKISGFSNYLHPVDNESILAVGQEARDGRAVGLQVSMFNVSDPRNASLQARYTVEEDDDNWSSSEAQFEHKAFRYLARQQMLILPARISGEDTFDGFLIFDVNKTHIEPNFNITHTRSYQGCNYNAYLQARSIVINEQVTTFKGHTIKNHNLTTRDLIWDADLDKNLTKEDCVWYL
mmetsp:Transcript_7054/g.9378  ORF Transcript_7054/g.9378 Transcript_7054/m.9378 type:complete len:1052 (-) Transcript_7054:286-3441(-)